MHRDPLRGWVQVNWEKYKQNTTTCTSLLQPGPGVFCALAELSQPHVIPLTYRDFINSCPISFLRLFEPIGQGLWDTLVQSADQPDININFSLNVRIVCTYIEFTITYVPILDLSTKYHY